MGQLQDIKYISYFVVRSFLIAILCTMTLSGFAFILYFGDMLISAKEGNFKNPLFGAYVIVSPSMVPTIKINDAIVIKGVDNDKYEVGDIITFSSSIKNYEGEAVTHRIVGKEKKTADESVYTTKGDNNLVVDPANVKTNAIYGKVLFKVPAIGYAQSYLSKPINFFLCLLIPAIIFIVYDLSRIYFMMYFRRKI